VKFTFIINGEETQVECLDTVMMWVPRLKALTQSGNTGRPPADFDIRMEDGFLIDPLWPVSALEDGQKFFLSPFIGCGGSEVNHQTDGKKYKSYHSSTSQSRKSKKNQAQFKVLARRSERQQLKQEARQEICNA
jgi:hypothetical protein